MSGHGLKLRTNNPPLYQDVPEEMIDDPGLAFLDTNGSYIQEPYPNVAATCTLLY